MKIYLIVFFALFTLMNCTKTETKSAGNSAVNSQVARQTLTIDSISVADSMSLNKNITAVYNASILVFPSITDKTLLDSIYARENLQLKSYKTTDLKTALDAKMNNYFTENKKVLEEYNPNFEQTWYENSSMKLKNKLNQLVIIQYSGDGYTGGAHGYYYEFYETFDVKNHSVLQLKDVFSNRDPKIWNDILVNYFLKKNDEQILFEKKIPLTSNFYFDEKTITFVYNQYEIAPYSSGVITVNVPFSALSKYLHPTFKKELSLQ